MRFLRLVGPLFPLLTLTACEVTFLSISTDGRIEISVVTNGSTLDLDGYSVAVDGILTQAVDANGAITVAEISQGTHMVQLSGLAENCAVEGENPRTIVVPSGETSSISFVVVCRPRIMSEE
jgi:hypothetical protein